MSGILYLKDERVTCLSIIFEQKVGDYLQLVQQAYASKGGIDNQRAPLKTTTARRIRERMKSDIVAGAVFPPIVVGLVASAAEFSKWQKAKKTTALVKSILAAGKDRLSIIDGMQRTTALFEVSEKSPGVDTRKVRVELWIAKDSDALIYRMLVLNAGQIPWDVKRQIAVIFDPLIEETERKTGVSRIIKPEGGRRFKAGEYTAADLAEMYIAFGARKTNTAPEEILTDEFANLDISDSIVNKDYGRYFYACVDHLVRLDHIFASYRHADDVRTNKGRQIFDKQAARIGFLVACATQILGRPGSSRTDKDQAAQFKALSSGLEIFDKRLTKLSNEQLGEFLKIDVLEQLLDRRVGQVGRYERTIFLEAFKTLIDTKFAVKDMEVCWRSGA